MSTVVVGITYLGFDEYHEVPGSTLDLNYYGPDTLTRNFDVRPDKVGQFLTDFPVNTVDTNYSGMYLVKIPWQDVTGAMPRATLIFKGCAGASSDPTVTPINISSFDLYTTGGHTYTRCETASAHGFSVGDQVLIQDVADSFPNLNGTFNVIAVFDSTHFSINQSLILIPTPSTGTVVATSALQISAKKSTRSGGITQQTVTLTYDVDGDGKTLRQKQLTYNSPWTEFSYVTMEQPSIPKYSGQMLNQVLGYLVTNITGTLGGVVGVSSTVVPPNSSPPNVPLGFNFYGFRKVTTTKFECTQDGTVWKVKERNEGKIVDYISFLINGNQW